MKRSTIPILLLSLSFLFNPVIISAQAKKLSEQEQFKRAKELYNNDLYVSAENEFRSLLENPNSKCSVSEVEAYLVFCSIKLKKPNLDDIVTDFFEKYPYAPELGRVKFAYSCYFFEKQEYVKSLELINQINISSLPKDSKIEYHFNRAYCNMRLSNIAEATRGFDMVLSLPQNKYTKPSRYYRAYISYLSGNFTEAISLFESLEKDSQYGTIARYYLLESHFMLKRYDYVSEKGEEIYASVDLEYKPKVARIISEAYFALDKPREAKTFFDFYSESMSTLSRKDNYYLGVVSYSLESYYTSIDAFSKVTLVQDSLGQSAFYHLGNCYIKIKNKHMALSAFRSAAELNFDLSVKEDAMFNYAKLAFDINSDISVFANYLELYPSSERSDVIYDYISTSYLLKKDYDAAIQALEKIKRLTPEMTLNLQKAAFFRAIQYIESGAHRAAAQLLDLSIRYGRYNDQLTALAQFWLGEVNFRNGMYGESVFINQKLLNNQAFKNSKEYPMVYYNLGYAYFKQSDFENAANWFRNYINLPASQRVYTAEAKTRLADCCFMMRDYEQAAFIFEEVAESNYDKGDLYAAYYSALSYGLLSQTEKKIEILERITRTRPDSDLYNQSLFELGRTYTQADRYDNARTVFSRLIAEGQTNPYYLRSLLEMGMISSNMSQNSRALEYYKKVVEVSPVSEEAVNALAGIENIYQSENRTQEYLAYLERTGLSSVKSEDEKEMMLFNSAEQVFLAGDYSGAAVSLTSYIKEYPNSSKLAQATFYLAEALNKTGRYEESADAYLKVMMIGEGAFVELSTLNFAKLSYRLQRWQDAIDAYESLSSIAQLDNNKFEAQVGKMRSYYSNNDYDQAIIESQKIVQSQTGRVELKREANYIIAKSYMAKGERENALPILAQLSNEKTTAEGAEASYLLIVDAYDAGDFISVENQVFNLSDSSTPQLYWLAKSFIVLGDSYAEREEWEQAEATFTSIKDGYTPQTENDDVLGQVNVRLNKIKQR